MRHYETVVLKFIEGEQFVQNQSTNSFLFECHNTCLISLVRFMVFINMVPFLSVFT